MNSETQMHATRNVFVMRRAMIGYCVRETFSIDGNRERLHYSSAQTDTVYTVCVMLRRDAVGATVGRKFDAASPVTRSLDVTVALLNSRAPDGTDTNRIREVDQATHVVASNRMIESRQRG